MKKKILSLLVVLLSTWSGNVAFAQFIDNEIYYYIEAGASFSENSCAEMAIVGVTDGRLYVDRGSKFKYLKDVIKRETDNFYSLDTYLQHYKVGKTIWVDSKDIEDIDYSNTTNKYNTYKATLGGYCSISKDGRTLIRWYDDGKKYYYHLIDKSELNPKALNKDFLYE